MSERKRGAPLVSHRLFNDTFAVIPLAGPPAVFGREEAHEVFRALGELLFGYTPPSPKDAGTLSDRPEGVETC